jgi:hypothetical protein
MQSGFCHLITASLALEIINHLFPDQPMESSALRHHVPVK